MVFEFWRRSRSGERPKWVGSVRAVLFPVIVGLWFLWMDALWFLPLKAEAAKAGEVSQAIGWFASWGRLIEPLWLERFLGWIWALFPQLPPFKPIDSPETVVTVGWLYWVPAVVAVRVLWKSGSRPRLVAALPFLTLLLFAALYMHGSWAGRFAALLQAVVPFMRFFRVASRWGLFLPQILLAIVVLAWPELSRWVRESWWQADTARRGRFRRWVAVFCALSVIELSWLLHPINAMPPPTPGLVSMLGAIHDLPGDTVLDLPFCTAGGNGVCTGTLCPQYPQSVVGQCLRQWHGKKVFGLYQARMTQDHCAVYERAPYETWLQAWHQQRCFRGTEWNEFCGFLSGHPEISAVLYYPEVWKGAGPECEAEFAQRLGAPLGRERTMTGPSRGGAGSNPTQVVWFPGKCR